MHDESKAGKVIVQVNDCLVELLAGLKNEEAVVDVKRRVEIERCPLGGGVLAQKSASARFGVSIFVFGKVCVLYWLGSYLQRIQEGLNKEKKKDGGHVVALMHTGSVVDFGVFLTDFNFNFAVGVELFNIFYDIWRQAILIQYWHRRS